MAENNYSVKVPLDSRSLPTKDNAVIFDVSEKKFGLQAIDDFRSTNICIEYKIDVFAGSRAMASPLERAYNSNFSSPPSDGVVAQSRTGEPASDSTNYPLKSFDGDVQDEVHLRIQNLSTAYDDYLEDIVDEWENASDRGIIFCYNSTFSESFFAFKGDITAYNSNALEFSNVQFLDYQYNPFTSRISSPGVEITNSNYRWWRDDDQGNEDYSFLFLNPSLGSKEQGNIYTGTQASTALTANNKNIILTAKDNKGNDVKEYLVAEGGGTIKFVDKSNPENYIVKRFQRSFILRGDEDHFDAFYYVVFTNLEDVAKGGTIASNETTTSDVFCVEVTPNDQGTGTNNLGGVPNNTYTPWVTHRIIIDDSGVGTRYQIGRKWEGGYRGGNTYGYSTEDGLASREFKINIWCPDAVDFERKSSGLFTNIIVDETGDDAGEALVNTYPNDEGVILLPSIWPISPTTEYDNVGWPVVIKNNNTNSGNVAAWVSDGMNALVTYRSYFTNLNS